MLVPMVALLAAGRSPGRRRGLRALTSVHRRSEPYRQQARTLAAVAVTMVVSVAIGDLIAVHGPSGPWQEALSLLATALVGAITTAAATAVKLGPPGGLIFAFATGACSHLPLSHADLPLHLLVTALSAALAWGVSIAGAVVIGLGPQRRAVAAALEATAAHVEARLTRPPGTAPRCRKPPEQRGQRAPAPRLTRPPRPGAGHAAVRELRCSPARRTRQPLRGQPPLPAAERPSANCSATSPRRPPPHRLRPPVGG